MSDAVELPFKDIVQRLAVECEGPEAWAKAIADNWLECEKALVARGWGERQIQRLKADCTERAKAAQ